MKINYQDIITLSDNNEYVVASKAMLNDEEFLYLVDIHNNNNLKFARVENDDSILALDTIKNEELIKKLIPLFYNNSKNDIEGL